MAGDLNVTWIHGSANCATTTDPPIQVHRYTADTFILRQSKCSDPEPSFEAPFMYLLLGTNRALLLDTGASSSAAKFPIAAAVNQLVSGPLLVAHSHSHGDHLAGDSQFQGRPNTKIVPSGLTAVKNFYGLPGWPNGTATIDLGGRILDVIPLPGHEPSHIAIYDRKEKLLLTGDALYPGLLVINDWQAYTRSIARLKTFVATNPVTFILGAHIEMTTTPKRWFGLGVLFQPNEHKLQLTTTHLDELNTAVSAMGAHPRTERHNDFIIFPGTDPLPAP